MATFTGGLKLALATLQTVTNTVTSEVSSGFFFFNGGDQRALILKEHGQELLKH